MGLIEKRLASTAALDADPSYARTEGDPGDCATRIQTALEAAL
jgi:hypothetical protein